MASLEFVALPGVDTAAPFPLVVIDARVMADLDTEWPCQAIIATETVESTAWLYSTDQFPQERPEEELDRPPIWLSPRARRVLDVSPGDSVWLMTPAPCRRRVLSALIDDLPRPGEVHVSHQTRQMLASERGSALLTWRGWCAPVRVVGRDMEASTVRMSMVMRTLVGATPDEEGGPVVVSLTPLWTTPNLGESRAQDPSGRVRKIFRPLLNRGRAGWRQVTRWCEWILVALLGAPSLTLRTAEASIGDDDQHIVRLPADALTLLGVAAGGQVIVGWGDHEVVGVALLTPDTSSNPEPYLQLQRVERVRNDPGSFDQPAANLTAGVAAGLRAELGIPRRTVITVRRRLLPRIAARANELVLPLGGLLVAALAIRGFRVVWVAIAALVILFLSFTPLRHHRPPPGRWR